MKGTAPRGATAQEDEALKQALAANPKDRAENLMIVDLMRNDLSRVAVPGTVKVRDAFAVETYPTVHQMVTTVTAQVLPGTQVADVLRAIFPAARSPARPRSGRWNGSTWPNAMRAASIADRSAISTCPIRPRPANGDAPGAGSAAFNVAIRTVRLVPDHPGAAGGGRPWGSVRPWSRIRRCSANGANAW
jgi:para-aminobenzoate synthetase/4-amino-4-deoxychorismate lyase